VNVVVIEPRTPLTATLFGRRVVVQALLLAVGVLLLTVSAKARIPLWPVPMTMQTFIVLLLAMAYGTRLGTATLGAYLAAGALGAPVFAGTPEQGVGGPYMLGPQGGYLVGFLRASILLGRLAGRGWDRKLGSSLAAMTLGHLLILACGVLWLAATLGMERALAVGFTPFILATIIKTLLAAAVLPPAWRLVARLR
jgi:biotin transport system substrate-specific component